jgi:hypothetical protein
VKGPPSREGHEHRVFYHLENDPPRVTKVTFPHKYGRFEYTPFLYLERLALSNALFPVLNIRLEDFVKAGSGQYSIISSMRAFTGPSPGLTEIDRFLRARGFTPISATTTIDYANPEIGICLRDCHPLNGVKSPNGALIPIDIVPERIV